MKLPLGVTGFDREDGPRAVLYGWDFQSVNNPISAGPASVQATATKLVAGINVISTAVANGSVALPAYSQFQMPEEGLCIATFNTSGQYVNVYPAAGDSINGLGANIAASIMPNSIVYFTCVAITAAGVCTWLATGIGNGYASSGNGSFPTYSSIDNLAPTPAGTQANAAVVAQSTAGVTSGAGTDAVRLPPAKAGMEVTIINKSAANALTVFPASAAQGGIVGGDNFNNQGANAALTGGVSAATVLLFYCLTDGTWWSK